jgi:hypothetical protein
VTALPAALSNAYVVKAVAPPAAEPVVAPIIAEFLTPIFSNN